MKKNLKSVCIYGALAALCLATLPAFLGTRGPWAVPQKSERVTVVEPPAALDPHPVVGVGRGEEYGAVTEAAIENAGGLDGIVKKGDVVLIKPNLCTSPAPGTPTTTDYRVVQRIVEMVKKSGASRVIIAEGGFSGNAFSKSTAARSKYDTIAGVEFYDFNSCEKEDSYLLTPRKSLIGRSLYIPKPYMDATVVIDVAKLKTHFQPDAVVSLSLKNAFGVPSERLYGGYWIQGRAPCLPACGCHRGAQHDPQAGFLGHRRHCRRGGPGTGQQHPGPLTGGLCGKGSRGAGHHRPDLHGFHGGPGSAREAGGKGGTRGVRSPEDHGQRSGAGRNQNGFRRARSNAQRISGPGGDPS